MEPQEDKISRLTADRDRHKKMASIYQEEAALEKFKSITQIEEHEKKEAEWEKERESERRRREKELEEKVAMIESRNVEERLEWERKRLRKEEEERKMWEERMQDVQKECQKKVEEETRRWEAILERQKAEGDLRYAREREVWQRELDDERSTRDLLASRSATGSTSRRNSERTTSLMQTAHSTMPIPASAQSTPAPGIAKNPSVITPKPEIVDDDIIDLCRDTPPAFKMEVDQPCIPDIITIDDDDEDDDDAEPANPTPRTTQPLPPTPASSSSQTPALSKAVIKKSKIEGFTLSNSRRAEYLSGTTLFSATSDFLPVCISRAILTKLYHSKTMGLAWVSPDDKHHFLTPSYDWNPDMPRAPGEPGLLLVTYDFIVEHNPWSVFFRLEDPTIKTVRWGYAGEYVCKEVGRLVKEEFEAQDDVVKKTWGSKVCARLGEGTLLEMRARIALRKYLKREPTHDEMRAEASKIKKKVSKCVITAQDVVDAIVKGEEHIKVIQIQCVGYDHARAEVLMNTQEEYEKEEEKKKAVRVKAKATATKNKKTRTSKKRTREASVDTIILSDDDQLEDEVDDEGDISQPPSKIRRVVDYRSYLDDDEEEESDDFYT